MSFEDLPPWGPRLIRARLLHKWFGLEPVEFVEPVTRIGNHRLSNRTPTPICRMRTSFPSNLNSRGNRTAWLRPFRNSFAVLVVDISELLHRYRSTDKPPIP